MVKKNISKILSILLLAIGFSSLNSKNHIHTIYIVGPATKNNWFKESKDLYKGLKLAAKKTGDSIEMFPQKKYRQSVFLSKKQKIKRKFQKNYYGRMPLTTFYNAFQASLVRKLVKLIKKRHKQIVEYGGKINLISYGRGSEILEEALEIIRKNKMQNKIGTVTAVESPKIRQINSELIESEYESSKEEYYYTQSSEYETETEEGSENNENWIEKLKKETKKKDRDKTVVYITINQIKEETEENDFWEPGQKCSVKKFIITAGAFVGLVTGIAALL